MIVAAVPLKNPARSKSRLAPRLSPWERAELALQMLERVLDALRTSPEIARIALVTPDPASVPAGGVTYLPDAGDLNASLNNAVRWARNADALLIVPADLPLITPADIGAMIEGPASAVTIAPSHNGGTGALLLRPPDVIDPAFGSESFAAHRRAAEAQSVTPRIVHRHGLAFDVDTVADLDALTAASRPE